MPANDKQIPLLREQRLLLPEVKGPFTGIHCKAVGWNLNSMGVYIRVVDRRFGLNANACAIMHITEQNPNTPMAAQYEARRQVDHAELWLIPLGRKHFQLNADGSMEVEWATGFLTVIPRRVGVLGPTIATPHSVGYTVRRSPN